MYLYIVTVQHDLGAAPSVYVFDALHKAQYFMREAYEKALAAASDGSGDPVESTRDDYGWWIAPGVEAWYSRTIINTTV